YMATTMVRQSGVTPISTVGEGAEAILNLAVADELDGRSGQFYDGLRPSKANPQAYDYTAREQLRVLSLQLTGVASSESKDCYVARRLPNRARGDTPDHPKRQCRHLN